MYPPVQEMQQETALPLVYVNRPVFLALMDELETEHSDGESSTAAMT
jgi:hypothetical protein